VRQRAAQHADQRFLVGRSAGGVHLGDDRARPARPRQVPEDLGDRLVARARHQVLVDEAAGPWGDDPVAEVHVAEARPERQGEVEGVAPGDGGVREVEHGRVDVEGRRVVSGGVHVGDDGPDTPGEHVLDRELDARRGRQLPHQVDEARRVPPLPAEGRVHDDGPRAELGGQLGRSPQLVALVAAEREVR
jgi:hypothetical protein